MAIDVNRSAALTTAWLELCWRTGALQQEWASRWLQYWAESAQQAIDRTLHDAEGVAGASDWKSSKSQVDEAAWSTMRGGLDGLQRFTSTAMDSRSAYMAGMREALQQWQRESARALHARRSAMPMYTAIRGALNSMAMNAVDPGPAPGAPQR